MQARAVGTNCKSNPVLILLKNTRMQTHVQALQNKSSVHCVHNAYMGLGLCNIAGRMLWWQNKSCVHSSESLAISAIRANQICTQCIQRVLGQLCKNIYKHMLSLQIKSVRNASKGTLVNCAITVLDWLTASPRDTQCNILQCNNSRWYSLLWWLHMLHC